MQDGALPAKLTSGRDPLSNLADNKKVLENEKKLSFLLEEKEDEAEERNIGQKLKGMFEELVREGKTVSDVKELYKARLASSGWWSSPSGFKRFIRFYEAWCIKNAPQLVK
ncbi:hypothetical protein GN958_ATG18622 [Phytophthora infestans]|uniref:Uncharacterized protein n=1 Tax=Phytophthora infestans TaxID=4787 RepID=A0A8S9TZV0_PHYIN|nr:hypothetical protein GN958_ATG18622 [Phytophthora infestans]